MGDIYKLNDNGGGASASLFFRFFRLVVLLTIIAFVLFYFKLGMDNFYMAEIAIVAFALIVYLPKREAERVHFDNGKIVITGRRFLFFKFKNSAPYTKVKYKFKKASESKGPISWFMPKKSRLSLYKDGSKWVDMTGGATGWSRIRQADLVKTLIAKGCYNWFEFNKKGRSRRK